jgi:periplasmic divalent cation tolerance protein
MITSTNVRSGDRSIRASIESPRLREIAVPSSPSPAAAQPDFVVVLVTVPDAAVGETIARALLAERLAACVSRVGPVRSLFRWKGEVDAADEQLLVVKARRSALPRVETLLKKLHPYEVPELLALPVVGGGAAYLDWLAAETDA